MSDTEEKTHPTTKPYLIRAIYEWCTDNGYTPYLAVVTDANTRVPVEFVKDGQIVLNVSFEATSGLKMGNDYIEFAARFGGVQREIMVPVARVAVFAGVDGGHARHRSRAPRARRQAEADRRKMTAARIARYAVTLSAAKGLLFP